VQHLSWEELRALTNAQSVAGNLIARVDGVPTTIATRNRTGFSMSVPGVQFLEAIQAGEKQAYVDEDAEVAGTEFPNSEPGESANNPASVAKPSTPARLTLPPRPATGGLPKATTAPGANPATANPG
jgi:hypothetical protein